jgi:O-antigen/teichoic acid export membrane protein
VTLNTQSPISSPGRKIATNAFLLGTAGAMVKLIFLGFHLYVADRLGREVFGDYTFVVNAIAILLVISDLGVEYLAERELARRPADLPWGLRALILLRGLSLVPSAAILILAVGLSQVGREVPPLLLWAPLLLVVMAFFNLLRTALRSTERMGFEAGLNTLERLLFIALGVLALAGGQGLLGLVRAQTIAVLVGLVCAGCLVWMLARRITPSPSEPTHPFLTRTLRQSFPFWLTALCSILLFREDSVMLYWLKGDAETGTYGVPFRLMEGLLLLTQVISMAVYPTFSKSYHEGRALESLFHPLFRFLLAAGALFAGIGIVFSEYISVFLEAFEDSAGVFRLLLVSTPFIYANYLVGTTMRAVDQQKANLLSATIALAVNFVGNLCLIPLWGAMGAAAATVLTQAVYLAVMMFFLRNRVRIAHKASRLLKLLVLTLPYWAYAFAGRLPLLVRAATGPIAFLLALAALGVLDAGEIRRFFAPESDPVRGPSDTENPEG